MAEATHGKDPDLVVAALLHDAIEDQEVPRELIEREFGKRVVEVVSQVTDDKTLPKEKRKENSGQNRQQKTNDAKIIKLADKTSNLPAITFSPAPNWSVKRRLEYIGWAREVVKQDTISRPSSRCSEPARSFGKRCFGGAPWLCKNGLLFETRSRWLVCSRLSRSRKQVWHRIGGTTNVHHTRYALVWRSPQSHSVASVLFFDMQAERFGRSKLHLTLW